MKRNRRAHNFSSSGMAATVDGITVQDNLMSSGNIQESQALLQDYQFNSTEVLVQNKSTDLIPALLGRSSSRELMIVDQKAD